MEPTEGAAVHEVEGEAASPQGERRELKSPGYEIFIAALSILSIVNLVLGLVVREAALDAVLSAMNAGLSVILFIDFLVRLRTAPSRSDYFFRSFGWADLLASLPLPQLKILRLFRLARVYRLLRAYGARNIGRSLLRERAGSALLSLLFIAILVLEFGSLWMLRLESTATDHNITTASDAMWYVIVTISTVGYGDQYPVTTSGRVLGTIIIVLGVAIFGTLTGYLANLFLSPTSDDKAGSDDTAGAAEDARDRRLAQLTRAGELHRAGVLSQAEFELFKAEILSAPPA
ncbi:voltage-gated potassium channel [Humibacillus xanthopallidus]|uniref:Voltage-gated potassium channel n=1 Tax=Humibacillus xanthopallidus TaxID=412689 RepID=A0A543PSB5_9MICO|nr:ion transporter [Humibacillus xanthopallidus]TQN46969.1 voltage-gated potassium channel [Humibacillus xanthopallidus]